jgi:hypothetical protein
MADIWTQDHTNTKRARNHWTVTFGCCTEMDVTAQDYALLTSNECRIWRFSQRLLRRVISSGYNAVCCVNSKATFRRQNIPRKCRLTFNGLHGITSQKTEMFVVMKLNSQCVGVKFGRPHEEENIDWGVLRATLRRKCGRENEEGCIMRTFIICCLHGILLGWLNLGE